MLCKRLLLSALVAASMLTACASLTTREPALSTPLPAAYIAAPPLPVERQGNSPDDVALALKRMYDMYGLVAGQLVDLIGWVQGQREEASK